MRVRASFLLYLRNVGRFIIRHLPIKEHMKIIKPHGGKLVNRETTSAERERLIDAAQSMPALRLNGREISDLEMIATGAYSPLEGFMDPSDYNSVCRSMRLANGVAWPIPVTLSLTDQEASSFRPFEDVALYQGDHLLGIIHLAEKFRYDKEREAELVYRTTDAAHPGVRTLYNQGEWLVGGKVSLLNRPLESSFPNYRRDPAATRELFRERGWRRVVAFQTRNPVHRAHEYIQKCALEIADGLLLHPLVGETNDGLLNDIRGRHVTRDDVLGAIKNAKGGAVEEGAVGAGAGTVAFGFKGGIGTSSRRLPASLGGYTVGVLVQTNFGGVLTIAGAPVGQELGRYYLKQEIERSKESKPPSDKRLSSAGLDAADGSVIIVIATDAPVDSRNLRRMAARSMMGLARTGSAASNGSGDYAIAFSTAPEVRIQTRTGSSNANAPRGVKLLSNDAMSPLFLAVIEATEEAVYDSLFRATTMTSRGHTVEALPIDRTIEILRKHGAIRN